MLKNTYSTPEAELVEIGFERNILSFDKEENNELFIDDGEENL